MEKYIYEIPYAFSGNLCDEIINNNASYVNYFDSDKKYQYKLVDPKIDDALIENINKELDYAFKSIDNGAYILLSDYQFCKFEKCIDYKTYSYDLKLIRNMYSRFEFVFFLNDVENGGEVEIMGKIKIKAEKGKLLIFPSGWCFPYSHKMPVSDNKYVITGKIFKMN